MTDTKRDTDQEGSSKYSSMMSLASEIGDSSLVYRFMSMASSNAIWSSRAAFGRFGLSNVLSDSSVDGYLAENPKLYPKLFRYRFDPNTGVQRSMNDIWTGLVKDSSATIDKHYDAIMEELLSSILNREWRVRQASCAAIADLVQGRPLDIYEKYLERIWSQCFKVLDDIKESVRAAAASLARVLTGVLTRSLEADGSSSKNAASMLKHVLPFLLSPSGLESSAKEVQIFALQTLLEIIKKSSAKTLQPFIPELVERLLGLLSSLEPEEVNYIHLNAAKYKLTEQKIDGMRLSSVRSSPLMEAIERCLDLLDETSMQRLRPSLESAMKSAVGLPSKVGCSRVLVSLSTRHNVLFKPFSDDFLKLIERHVLDRNETVSSSYAAAAGYVARGASDKQILQLSAFAKRLYFESEHDRESSVPRRSIASGEIVYAMSKYASDRFSALAADLIPFVFVAKHDTHEQVKEQFQNTWNDTVGGPRAVLLYLKEIIDTATRHLDSPQWVLKHTAARTVADAVAAVISAESQLSDANANILWPALEKAIGGKTWAGKEIVLTALVKFAEAGKTFLDQDVQANTTLVKIAIREAKRQNAEYRQYSIKALGSIAAARAGVDLSDAVFDIIDPIIQDLSSTQPMEVDGGQDEAKKDQIQDVTIAGAIEALCMSQNVDLLKKGPDPLQGLLKVLTTINDIPLRTVAVETAKFNGIKKLMDRYSRRGSAALSFTPEVLESLRKALFGAAPGSESLRLLRAEAILSVTDASSTPRSEVANDISILVANENSGHVRSVLERARAASLAAGAD